MSDSPKVLIEYIGPPNQDWNDGDKFVTLVAGRRYPVDATLAAYLVERNPTHWKRPDEKKDSAAKKEL